ncbi:hypothetical protein P3T36_000590 [Kitasatospora sp. MAP12-15]|uniref:radical SAM/SPASM domain-containing protein n=1 Tax=unclassified Kitasatospora TaxID=2633591 RepID=UPI0024730516|nr:radical SAM/SPASM domain-containing protein [Kitasatospora sp. MAP12-44]MDH6114189.1 hypothetical protein [Kitasatospora sp. MAP12-44]
MLPDLLQTSPYLTVIRSGEPAPVIYMTDTRGPTLPVITDPAGAAYGVIGLGRRVDWQHDAAGLAALNRAARDPLPAGELAAEFGQDLIEHLTAKGWLQPPEEICAEYRLLTAQIEITAHCNWRCRYCPVSTEPKPAATMPMDLYEEILGKLQPHAETIKFVTFHFFNEPTLDRFFDQRVHLLADHHLKLSLSTNASALTPAKIDLLAQTGVLHHLVVNIPSLDAAEFQRLTGATTYRASLRHLDLAIDAGFPITVAVNGTDEDLERSADGLRERYEPRGVTVHPTQTCDRAGVLTNEYHQDVHAAGRLGGCSWPLNHAYFSVTGDLFACCNDFHQREVFGHIRDGSLHEIMTSPAAIRLRRRVFGAEDAPADFLCRTCHDQRPDFPERQFRPLAAFPATAADQGR